MNEIATPLGAAASEGSIFAMFWSASLVVKLVMVGLLAASIWCWAIIINKTLLIRRARVAIEEFETVFWSGNSLEDLYQSLSARPTTATAPPNSERPRSSLPLCCSKNSTPRCAQPTKFWRDLRRRSYWLLIEFRAIPPAVYTRFIR